MKFTSEDLMKAMGLQVGDRFKFNDFDWDNHIYEIIIEHDLYLVKTDLEQTFPLYNLLNREFEILPRPKKVGDLKCIEYKCVKCPLRSIRCEKNDDVDNSLYYILEKVLVGVDFDQEIYDILKTRLDKEVEE